jgi:hypothetical protein
MLAGVSTRSLKCGLCPDASRLAPSARTPPATPPAILPSTPSRDRRPRGIARPPRSPSSFIVRPSLPAAAIAVAGAETNHSNVRGRPTRSHCARAAQVDEAPGPPATSQQRPPLQTAKRRLRAHGTARAGRCDQCGTMTALRRRHRQTRLLLNGPTVEPMRSHVGKVGSRRRAIQSAWS